MDLERQVLLGCGVLQWEECRGLDVWNRVLGSTIASLYYTVPSEELYEIKCG